jgi:hypothetical protein
MCGQLELRAYETHRETGLRASARCFPGLLELLFYLFPEDALVFRPLILALSDGLQAGFGYQSSQEKASEDFDQGSRKKIVFDKEACLPPNTNCLTASLS